MEQGSLTTTGATWELSLKPSKAWRSFEEFRLEGANGIAEAIPDGQVGFLTIRGIEFAVLRRRDFSRLLGLAAEVHRMARGIPLLKQAAELVWKSSDQELAIRHFQQLSIEFPDVVTAGSVDFGEFAVEGLPGISVDLDSFTPPRAVISSS
jgi:hypothetical protein